MNDDATPRQLRGWTAVQWGRPLRPLGTLMLVLTALSGLCYFLVGGTAESVPPWLYALFCAAILTFAAGLFFFFSGMVKAIRESHAGYTTTGGLYPELPQLDQRGEVLRTPEEREVDRAR